MTVEITLEMARAVLAAGDQEARPARSSTLAHLLTGAGFSLPAQGVPEGTRNDTMVRYVGHLRGRGLKEHEIIKLALAANLEQFHPPLPEEEVLSVCGRYARGTRESGFAPGHAASELYALTSCAELQQLPPMEWRVKGVLPTRGLAAIYGPSGSGKSFLGIDMAMAIADGHEWFGHRTRTATVVLVALEGEAGYRHRVSAWKKATGRNYPANMKLVLQQAFALTNPDDVSRLAVSGIPNGSVIIIDTLNRAAPTADENASKDMGEIIEGAKHLARLVGGLVVLVHHTGKDQSRGARGHSSFYAALDGAIEVQRSPVGQRVWSIAKAKDGEDGKQYPFKLVAHQLGVDADGEAITSCSVEHDLARPPVPAEPTGLRQKSVMAALRTAIAASPERGRGIVPHPTLKCIPEDRAIEVAAGALIETPANKRKHEAKVVMAALVKAGHLGTAPEADVSWVWLPADLARIQSRESRSPPPIGGVDTLDRGQVTDVVQIGQEWTLDTLLHPLGS